MVPSCRSCAVSIGLPLQIFVFLSGPLSFDLMSATPARMYTCVGVIKCWVMHGNDDDEVLAGCGIYFFKGPS